MPAQPIIHPKHRKQLAALMRDFLNRKMSAFEFDDLIDSYRSSADETVREIAFTCWFFYDDCRDHLCNFKKQEWDFFQRLLLVLESNHHLETTWETRWRFSQLVALLSLLACGGLLCLHFGAFSLLFLLPLGLVSMAIARVRSNAKEERPYAAIVEPFASYSQLKATYDNTPRFRKQRYPAGFSPAPIRSAFMEKLMLAPLYAAWLVLSPIPLCFQLFPSRIGRSSVKASKC